MSAFYNSQQKQRMIEHLLRRDGDACFFCHEPTTDDDRTLEHVIPVVAGGSSQIHNLRLAHRECNRLAGCLSPSRKAWVRNQLAGKGRNGWPRVRAKLKGAAEKPGRYVRRRQRGRARSAEEEAATRAMKGWGVDPSLIPPEAAS